MEARIDGTEMDVVAGSMRRLRVHGGDRPLEPSALHWWTHVFSARVVGERTLDPRDTWEIAEAHWVSVADLQGSIRETLLGTGKGLFG